MSVDRSQPGHNKVHRSECVESNIGLTEALAWAEDDALTAAEEAAAAMLEVAEAMADDALELMD